VSRLAPKHSVIKRLVASCGNECAFPDCKVKLVADESFIGHLIHISAAEPDGPRYEINMSDEERRDFNNLMFMCPTHHSVIDKKSLVYKYPIETLKEYKRQHEDRMKNKPFKASDAVFDEIIDEISVAQINILNSGTQTNIQNVYQNAEQFANAAKDTDALSESDDGTNNGQDDERPGLADKIAFAEEVMPQWTETILAMSAEG
jgi:hypothetical protein